jgi:hypothetical protein
MNNPDIIGIDRDFVLRAIQAYWSSLKLVIEHPIQETRELDEAVFEDIRLANKELQKCERILANNKQNNPVKFRLKESTPFEEFKIINKSVEEPHRKYAWMFDLTENQ